MTNRAIELAKECGARVEVRNSHYKGDDEFLFILTEVRLQAFYEAAKRDGMIEMRERIADILDTEYDAWEVAGAIRAFEVKP